MGTPLPRFSALKILKKCRCLGWKLHFLAHNRRAWELSTRKWVNISLENGQKGAFLGLQISLCNMHKTLQITVYVACPCAKPLVERI